MKWKLPCVFIVCEKEISFLTFKNLFFFFLIQRQDDTVECFCRFPGSLHAKVKWFRKSSLILPGHFVRVYLSRAQKVPEGTVLTARLGWSACEHRPLARPGTPDYGAQLRNGDQVHMDQNLHTIVRTHGTKVVNSESV